MCQHSADVSKAAGKHIGDSPQMSGVTLVHWGYEVEPQKQRSVDPILRNKKQRSKLDKC